MKNKILFSSLLLAGSIALTSCSDFLDAENKSNLESEKYFMTADGFENLAVTPYYKLRSIYSGAPNLFCSGTDLYEKGRSNYSSTNLSIYKGLNSSDGDVLSLYENCYDGIQQCNTVIYYAQNGAEGANVQKRVDEAKFLKAFYYYLLTQQIGGVPISDEYISSVITSFPRKSQTEIYDYIIGILKEVEESNTLPMEDHTGRVSMRAVYNLLAKVYLAYGWDANVSAGATGLAEGQAASVADKTNFQNAAKYADLAIASKSPSLSFSSMWDVANDNNADIIFAIQYTRGIAGQDETTEGNQQQAQFSNYYNDDGDGPGLTKYTSSQFPPSEKLIYLFEPGDERFDGTFMVEQPTEYKRFYTDADWKSQEIKYYFPAWYSDLSGLDKYNTASDNHTTTNIYSTSDPCVYIKVTVNPRTGKVTYKKDTQKYETSRTSTGTSLCVRKFDDYKSKRNGTKAVSFHDIVLAHLTETYLIAAEAYYMAGETQKSLDRLNVVRKRSNATQLTNYASYVRHYSDGTDKSYNNGKGIDNVPKLTGADLDPIDIILDERARELCGEYYRWMDLRRTKRLIDYNVKYNSGVESAENFLGADGQYRWFRPFPQDEINLNEGITDDDQNPGYKTSK
ncbi:MAG: RagB/SusD family nutrient uptake outer membrane protein [Prevotellaceae bacterium]|nr:RagB/SusD family nutrient uptake outer membrane protein [Prevotellaceae bacterium]